MRSNRLCLLNINQEKLHQDLKTIVRFNFSSVYDEFVCGQLKSCVLWNRRGDANNTILEGYNSPAKATDNAMQLPYLKELITTNFKLEYLRFARILMLTPNSVFMPHRDYLEINQNFIRIHVPLKTDENCFHSEEDGVYHMSVGEVWYLDASKVHSAASFSDENRYHLILDFKFTDNMQDLLSTPIATQPSIPENSIITRMSLTNEISDSIYALHKVIDGRNFYDIFAIIIKQYFKTNVNAMMVYEWLLKVAELSKNDTVIDKATFLKNYCLLSG